MASHGWTLRSSSGGESVTWTPRADPARASEWSVVCDVSIEGRYFSAALGGSADAPADYTLGLTGLALGTAELERLASFLESWLVLSTFEQLAHPPAMDCNLGALFDQSLTLSIGRRDDVLSGGKPVATIRFITGRLTGELRFVTDQSCLRLFCEGMRGFLEDAVRGRDSGAGQDR